MTNPKNHPLWDKFVEFAGTEGIGLEYEEDWLDWWKCFLSGAAAVHQLDAEASK